VKSSFGQRILYGYQFILHVKQLNSY